MAARTWSVWTPFSAASSCKKLKMEATHRMRYSLAWIAEPCWARILTMGSSVCRRRSRTAPGSYRGTFRPSG